MLIYCAECENGCSDKADFCPKCGHPLTVQARPIVSIDHGLRPIVDFDALQNGLRAEAHCDFSHTMPGMAKAGKAMASIVTWLIIGIGLVLMGRVLGPLLIEEYREWKYGLIYTVIKDVRQEMGK